jgi:hypothetical protein
MWPGAEAVHCNIDWYRWRIHQVLLRYTANILCISWGSAYSSILLFLLDPLDLNTTDFQGSINYSREAYYIRVCLSFARAARCTSMISSISSYLAIC